MPNQDGLEWVSETFGLEPCWTKDPDVDVILRVARKHLGHDEDTSINVSCHAQGGFNKLYKLSAVGLDCLMRVSLPVDPHFKTESEVATIDFIRENTDMPVPRIIAFDSDHQNELGFEWILMEKMTGVNLRNRWRKMCWEAKATLVKQLAEYQVQLFGKRFERIGNLFHLESKDKITAASGESVWYESFVLGRIVSLVFLWGDHLTHDAPRGPFGSSYEWLQTRLKFVLADQERILRTSDDEDDIEEAEFSKDLAEMILRVLPQVFPPHPTEVEPTILFHDDLSMQNILVNGEGKLTAIVDWECVSAVPLWRACQLPHLLEGRAREEKPDRGNYSPDSDDEGQGSASPNALDNEGINELYWDHLLEYEQTQLRKLFVEEMEKFKPDWVVKMKQSALGVDFDRAVYNCDN